MDYPQLLQGIFPAWSFNNDTGRNTIYSEFFDVLTGLQLWASQAGKRITVDIAHSVYVLPSPTRSKLDAWLEQLTEIRDMLNPAGAAAIARKLKVPAVFDHVARVLITKRESDVTRRLNKEDMHAWLMKLLTQTLQDEDMQSRQTILRLIDVVEASTAEAWRIVRPTKGIEVRAHVYTQENLLARPGDEAAKPTRVYLHSNGLFLLADKIQEVEVFLPGNRPRKRPSNAFFEPLLFLDKLKIYPVRPDGNPDHSATFCPIR